ncbi:GFA family protein [Gimibacter soli]|uniref:GFA family protein n=1 Tax=Gimibacter soli TaxID=3024400 RepID=A0AAE9XVT2_9PROT|nr:GFA family protein [Gimibacter soli]WCL54933.1 GFA family protein [Gimibacter soli]
MTDKVTHTGGCHCGAVRFEIDAPATMEVHACNCSICKKTGFLHLFVEKADFRLLTPWENIAEYNFGTRTARHFFCKTCGIKSFYVPRSHPHAYSVHAGCLEGDTVTEMTVVPFDGANWEQNVESIR